MRTRMTRTRICLVAVALVAVAVPACLQLPSPTRDAVARAPADKAAAAKAPPAKPVDKAVASKTPTSPPETTVSRRPAPPRLQYIDLRSVKVSPADPATEVTPVKAEQTAAAGPPASAPVKLDLPTIDGAPVIESPAAAAPQANSPILTALR